MARVVAACAVAVSGVVVPLAAVPATAAPAADPTLGHGIGNLKPYRGGSVSAATTLRARTAAVNTSGGTRVAATPPASVDLSPYAVSAGDQGQHGACASWATAYTSAGWDSNYQRHAGQPFAPMYVYNQVNGGSDTNGTYVSDNWSVLESQGVAQSSAWTHPAGDYRSQPTTAERANAAQHKMASHQLLFSGSRQGSAAQSLIQAVVANNQPVVLGIPVYARFFSLDATNNTMGLADATGSLYGYHAITILGYTSVGVQIENSWGTGWGRSGWATLRWDFVNQLAMEAWTTTGFVTTNISTPPVVGQLSPTVAGTGGGASLTVTGNGMSTVDATDPAAVTLVSTADPTVRATAAVTGSTASTLTVTLPAVAADGTYRVVVTGSGGASNPNGTADVLTLVTPYQVSLGSGQVARTNGGTKVTLVGAGFGSTTGAYAANVVTATVKTGTGSAPAVLTWVDDTRIQVTMPAGTAGVPAEVTVRRKGVAGNPVSVPYLPPLPVVSQVGTPAVSTAGGDPVVLTASNLDTVTGDITTVTLVNVANPTITGTATITARSGTALTVLTPPAPVDGDGRPVQGAYHVLVTNGGGSSLANGTKDVLTYLTPYSVGLDTGQVARSNGGTKVTLVGAGFGTTSGAFTGNTVTASATLPSGAVNVPVSWVDDGHLQVTMPAGTAGVPVDVTVRRKGVASSPVSVPYLPPLPIVTQVGATKVSTAGGASVLLGVTYADTVTSDITTVTLVNVADPTITVAAPITARTSASLTITIPAAPLDGAGKPVQGAYRIVVTGGGGQAAPKPAVDRVTYRTPLSGSVPAGTLASAVGGTPIAITGVGYGTTLADFTANAIKVLVNGTAVKVTWVSDTRLTAVLPAGTPGAVPAIVITHDTVPGAPIGTVSYAAVISASSAQSGPTTGLWTTTLAGAGFAGSTDWALVDSTGTVAATLPVVTTAAALDVSTGAVLITADGAAKVKLPAAPGGLATLYRLTFTPSGYQNAVLAFTSKTIIAYSDLG